MIDGHYFALILLTYGEIIASVDRLIAPAHFGYVDQALNTRSDFQECSVIFNIDDFTFDNITFFDGITDNIPWMWLELFEAKRDSLLVFIEIQYNDMYFLIDLQNFRWMVDTSPAYIGDV